MRSRGVANMEGTKEEGTRMLVSDNHLAASRLKMDEFGQSWNWVIVHKPDRVQSGGFVLAGQSLG